MARRWSCFVVWTALIFVGWMGTYAGAAGEVGQEELLERLDALTKLIEQQQQEIERLRREVENQRGAITRVEETQTRVEETRKAEVQEAVATEVEKRESGWKDSIPRWIRTMKVSGDLRLRYEGIYGRDETQSDGSVKDLPNRDRFRLRARLFFDGDITEEVSTHFMICTNQDANREATTTNQSFTDDFNDKGIYLHRAYATYEPKWLPGLELTGGKFKNTFLHTDIMWDPDVNPEGFYERYQYAGLRHFTPFVQFGQMVVNEVKNESDDAMLYIYQAGYVWEAGAVKWTMAGSYYDWSNLQNSKYLHTADYAGGGGNTFVLDGKGMLQYAYDFNLWEAYTTVDFTVKSLPVQLLGDYIVNVADRVPSDEDTAYYAGFQVGKAKKKGEWAVAYKYARIERNALIGSMNDQDFYGANRKGHKVKLMFRPLNHVRFDMAYFYTDPIKDWDPSDITFNKNKERMHEDRVQVDLIFDF